MIELLAVQWPDPGKGVTQDAPLSGLVDLEPVSSGEPPEWAVFLNMED